MNIYQVFRHPQYYDLGEGTPSGWYWWEVGQEWSSKSGPSQWPNPSGPYETSADVERVIRNLRDWSESSRIVVGTSREPGKPVPRLMRELGRY